jgi:hypothetical protein
MRFLGIKFIEVTYGTGKFAYPATSTLVNVKDEDHLQFLSHSPESFFFNRFLIGGFAKI